MNKFQVHSFLFEKKKKHFNKMYFSNSTTVQKLFFIFLVKVLVIRRIPLVNLFFGGNSLLLYCSFGNCTLQNKTVTFWCVKKKYFLIFQILFKKKEKPVEVRFSLGIVSLSKWFQIAGNLYIK